MVHQICLLYWIGSL